MKIVYSSANKNDAYRVAYVVAHSWKETYAGLVPDEYLDYRINDIDNRVESTGEFIENYSGKYMVVKVDDLVVGMCAFRVDDNRDSGHLDAMYLLNEYHGYGIGKELFKSAIDWFVDKGLNTMTLECMCGNDTINFYKKYGGEITSTIDYPIKGAGVVKADIVRFENIDKIFA